MAILVLLGYLLILLLLIKWNFYIALGFIALTSIVFKLYFPNIKGYIGEQRINKLLRKLGDDYKVFTDVYVKLHNGETTQIDHVVLSTFGIFVIETKNYAGWIFGSEKQKNWTQVIYKNKSSFYNPILQNKKHIRGLKEFLNLDENFHSIIVFSNEVTFKFKEDFIEAEVVKNKQLLKTIKKYNVDKIPLAQLNEAEKKLQLLVQENKRNKSQIKKTHIKQIKAKEITAIKKKETAKKQDKVCMKCGQSMFVKKGKYGAFYGCSSYPTCTYTEKLS